MREKLIEFIRKADKEDYESRTQDEHYAYMADRLIANGVTIQKWIPVSERLPEQGQEVIVYSGGVLKPTVFAYQFWDKHYDKRARITHWMPLPEPPKEG